jgi:hypothetical protein
MKMTSVQLATPTSSPARRARPYPPMANHGSSELTSSMAWCVILVVFASPNLAAADRESVESIRRANLAVPMQVEGVSLRSTLLLSVELERYTKSLEALAAERPDRSEEAFHTFTRALRDGDAATIAVMQPGQPVAELQSTIASVQRTFGGLDRITLLARARIGTHQTFVWEWSSGSGPVRRGFSIELSSNRPRVDFVTSNAPVDLLVVDIFQQAALRPRESMEVNRTPAYSCVIASAAGQGPSDRDKHEARLLFDGVPMAIDVLAANELADGSMGREVGAVVDAYCRSARALREGDLATFLEAHGERSRRRAQATLGQLTKADLIAYAAARFGGRRIRFVLVAEPVYLVFSERERPDDLEYEYMVRGEDGRFRFANTYSRGILDDVLGNRELVSPKCIPLVQSETKGHPRVGMVR